ncbi:MAG: pyruvate ferredoxin oxidoreductase, partial [Shimia sp.]|nr:pyruvate ferredoxin oxidoreductase [Shimia sp.]
VPVEDYLKPQRRFAHLFKKGSVDTERIAQLQAIADANIREYGLLKEESDD